MRSPTRAAIGTNRWGSESPRGALKRHCPTCGAKPYSSCFRVRALKVTGQDLTLPDPAYPVRLKKPHRQR